MITPNWRFRAVTLFPKMQQRLLVKKGQSLQLMVFLEIWLRSQLTPDGNSANMFSDDKIFC